LTVIAASTAVWVFILIPLVVIWALGIVDILRRHLPPAKTAAWILLVVLLPVVGTLLYFILRKPTEEEILGAQAAAAEQRDGSSVHQRLPDDY
jgi:hypothetical protein